MTQAPRRPKRIYLPTHLALLCWAQQQDRLWWFICLPHLLLVRFGWRWLGWFWWRFNSLHRTVYCLTWAKLWRLRKLLEPPARLHVWSNDVVERVVAADYAEACAILRQQNQEMDPDEIDFGLEREPDDRIIVITDDGGTDRSYEMTCAEWAMKNGKGFLCTTEW